MTTITQREPINRILREDVDMFRYVTERQTANNANALNEYQRIATKSAIYPGQGTPLGLIYAALKGCGEAGEFAEHVGKAMRDDGFVKIDPLELQLVGTLTTDRREKLIKEIGDQLWYLAAKCNELGITLSEAATANLAKLCDRGERDALRGSGDDR